MASSLLCGRRAATLLLVLACGCGKQEKSASSQAQLTPEQEAAAAEYAKLLNQQIDQVEATAAILATVQPDSAAKTAARDKLLALAVQMEALEKRVRREQPADAQAGLAAQGMVRQRRQQAAEKLLAEVRRINDMPGGRDFFDKELRPLLLNSAGGS